MGRGRRRRARRVCLVVCLTFLGALAVAPLALAASGSLLWTWSYPDPTGQASFRDMVTAPDGAMYAVGATSASGWDDGDALAVRFTAGDEPAWTKAWDSGTKGAYALAATTDASSDLIVGGMTATATSGGDWMVLKYSPEGELLWSQTIAGDTASYDWLNAVACDRAGNVYATGALQDATGNNCFAVVKLSAADGTVLWRLALDGLNADWHDDQAMDVAVDARGSVYATGIRFSADGTLRRCFTARLRPATGEFVWQKTIAPKGVNRYGYYLSPVGGSLYVQMYGDLPDETSPLMLAKYATADGTRSWLRSVSLKGASHVYPWDMTANKTGAVVVADANKGGGLIARFTPAGKLAWSRVYRYSPTRVSRTFHSVCMDADGRVWAAGQARIPGVPDPQADWIVQRFSPTGSMVWAKTLGGVELGWDGLNAVALGGTSALWVAGDLSNADGSIHKPTVGKYRR